MVRVFVAVVGVACALRGRLASALYLMNRTDIVTAVNTCKSNAASTGSSYNWDDCKDYPAGSFGIANWNVTNVGDFSLLFDGMTTFDADIKNWNMATATDLRGMFRGCTSFNADISSWNTKNVVDMSYMFDGATPFNANIKNWDTSEVTDMSYMFRECSDFNQDVFGWNTAMVKMKKALAADVTELVERDVADEEPASSIPAAAGAGGFMAPREEEMYRSFSRVLNAVRAVEAPIRDYIRWVKTSHETLTNISTSKEIPPKPPITKEVFEADMLDDLARHEDVVVEEARSTIAPTPDGRRNAGVSRFVAKLKQTLEHDCKRCVESIREKVTVSSFHEATFIADAYLRASAECASKLRELRASTRFLGDIADAAVRAIDHRRGYVEEAKKEALRLKRKEDKTAQENVLDDIFGGGGSRNDREGKPRESRTSADVVSGALGSNRGQTRAKKSSDAEREREGGQASSSYARAREWAMPDEDAMDALARARRVVHIAASASTTTAAPIESPAASTRRGDSKPKARERSFDPASML